MKVTVLDVGEKISYTKRGENQTTVTVALPDKSGVIRAEVFHGCNKMLQHKAFLIKNCRDNNGDHIVMTKYSRVLPAASSKAVLPELAQFVEQAAIIIKPTEALVADNLEEAKKSPIKSEISI